MFSPNNQHTVLIVEDELIQSMLLEKLIEGLGYEVIGKAVSGREAIDKALKLKPDIITMDITLQDEIDGIDAALEIQKTLPVPLIYITGNTDVMNSSRVANTIHLNVLSKPVKKDELAKTLVNAGPFICEG